LQHLEEFSGLVIDSIQSSGVERRNPSARRMRHVTLQGRLIDDLGLIVVDMDVEDGDGTKEDTPRIRTLDVEVDDPVFYSIGADILTK
jgi:hypothetical protein